MDIHDININNDEAGETITRLVDQFCDGLNEAAQPLISTHDRDRLYDKMVWLANKAIECALKSLAPVVGAEGGEQPRTDSPLHVVNQAEPGPDGEDDGPARASLEDSSC